MKLKTLSVFLGAIALVTTPLAHQVNAVESVEAPETQGSACPGEFEGIDLSEDQQVQLQSLEKQLEARIDSIMPTTSESEAQAEQLEQAFDQEVAALLSPEQKQQVGQLNAWADESVTSVISDLGSSEETALTEEQEAALEMIEAEYDRVFQSILTPEQQQQVASLEDQLDAEMEESMPEPSAEQAADLEAAEVEFEQGMMDVLTAEQLQQVEDNLAACSL